MPPRAPRRRGSAACAAALAAALLAVLLPAAPAAAGVVRFTGQVTDALRTPVDKLAAGSSGRAVADLVFLDRVESSTAYRTCISRRPAAGAAPVRTCFNTTTGAAGTATVTPLRFQRGRYVVAWKVAGAVVARWRFVVV